MKTLDLFSLGTPGDAEASAPLAERMRPKTIAEYIGQSHLLAEGSLLRRSIEEDKLFSMIFWGPPGSGKTTLARILANETKSYFVSFSAVLSGVKEIRRSSMMPGNYGRAKRKRPFFLLMKFTVSIKHSRMHFCRMSKAV